MNPPDLETHDGLAEDLRTVRESNGEIAVAKLGIGAWGGSGEMDVLAFRLSRTTPRPTCYEVKRTRSDFLADVRAGKFRKYEPWCERGYFAAPSGIIARAEVPDGWGLVTRTDTGWHGVKAAPRRRMDPAKKAALYLAVHLKVAEAPWNPSRETRVREAGAARSLWQLAQAVGGNVGDRLHELDACRRREGHVVSALRRVLGRDDDGTPGDVASLAALVERAVQRTGLDLSEHVREKPAWVP